MVSRIGIGSWISAIRLRAGNLALALATAMFASSVALAPLAHAQGYSHRVLYSFSAAKGDGTNPFGSLIQDAAGNLYGVTQADVSAFYGTIFVADRAGKERILYTFTGANGDGYKPNGGLVQDAAGNLYGTTGQGGTFAQGAVFVVNRAGEERLLYSFNGLNGGGDGAFPNGGLVQDSAGNLYGVTGEGGAFGQGVVFVVNKAGEERVLYSFTGSNGDGAVPNGGLVQDAAGNLYGINGDRGAFDQGTVFVVNRAGEERVLYSFTGIDGDGAGPNGGLLQDAAGNLYDTTYYGGASGFGTVFVVSRSGKEKVLHSFGAYFGDGEHPNGGLVQDAMGNLYGTTVIGGVSDGFGTIFQVNQAGQENVLYRFTGGEDGNDPEGGLIRDTAGNLYGTTELGGAYGFGTVFELTPLSE